MVNASSAILSRSKAHSLAAAQVCIRIHYWAFPFLVHMRFLLSLNLPQGLSVVEAFEAEAVDVLPEDLKNRK